LHGNRCCSASCRLSSDPTGVTAAPIEAEQRNDPLNFMRGCRIISTLRAVLYGSIELVTEGGVGTAAADAVVVPVAAGGGPEHGAQ